MIVPDSLSCTDMLMKIFLVKNLMWSKIQLFKKSERLMILLRLSIPTSSFQSTFQQLLHLLINFRILCIFFRWKQFFLVSLVLPKNFYQIGRVFSNRGRMTRNKSEKDLYMSFNSLYLFSFERIINILFICFICGANCLLIM